RDLADVGALDRQNVADGVIHVTSRVVLAVDDRDETVQLVIDVMDRREWRVGEGERQGYEEASAAEQKDGDGVPALQEPSHPARHCGSPGAEVCKDRATPGVDASAG